MSQGTIVGLADSERGIVPPDVLDDPDPGGSAVRRLGRALAAASYWIEQEMISGQGGPRQTALRLVAKIEQLVTLLDKFPPPLDPNIRYIPPCPVCKAKAGQHWAHDCDKLDHFGREVIYDYRRNRRIFSEQIRPLCEPLKPHPRDLYTCVVCRSQWRGRFAEEMVEPGDSFGQAEKEKLFKLIKAGGLE